MITRVGLLMLATSLLLLAASGCRSRELTPLGCTSNSQCLTGEACVASVCVVRAAPAGQWSVELVPPSDSAFAVTQINDVSFQASAVMLPIRPKAMITGNLGTDAALNVSSHVVATVPALIPGLPDRQFEGDWPAGTRDKPTQFMLSVPDNVLGMNAVLQVLPTPPDDHKQAPVSLSATLAPDMWLSLPAETLTVRGRLVSALIEPQTGFLARAFRGSQLISNIADTQYGGVFSLTIPTANLASDPTHTITVELTPKDDKAADPRFTSHAITLGMNADLGDLHLPTFGDPNVFRFDVRGDGAAAAPISGAVVRVRASIAGSADGMAEYARAGLTDAQGIADLSLLPGTIETLRPYDITVIPPSDSPFGVLCVPAFPLATGGTLTAPVLARKIALPRRPALSGRLTASDGNPVASMNIVATRIDSRPANLGACGSEVVSGSATVTTDKDGKYMLPMDPGTYRLDYDPPVGTAVPRLTESTITVGADQQRDITLQPARLIEGTVTGPRGEPVTAVGVHLFKVRCRPMQPCNAADGSTDPLLWAVGRTDIHGTFRLVIPQDSDQ